jgi:2-keto-4-pentenoate hydratase/2-oxohepta-3-ene-1,7-dioic acid hydratase in catechol pathway
LKLARYQHEAGEHWGAVDVRAGTIQRIAGPFEEWAPKVTAHSAQAVSFAAAPVPLAQVKLLAPLIATSEITGTGINYPSWNLPPEGSDSPFYLRTHSCMVGPEATIEFPQLIALQPLVEFCYEIELVAVMGDSIKDPKHGTRDVLGYTVGNDGCLRHQRPNYLGMDLIASKCGYHGSSLGPWIVTKDELGGEGQIDLEMIMRINGVVTQKGHTSKMNWSIDRLIYELYLRMDLKCGDLLFTGTPGYVGVPDGIYAPGDVLEAEISGIGILRNYGYQTTHAK